MVAPAVFRTGVEPAVVNGIEVSVFCNTAWVRVLRFELRVSCSQGMRGNQAPLHPDKRPTKTKSVRLVRYHYAIQPKLNRDSNPELSISSRSNWFLQCGQGYFKTSWQIQYQYVLVCCHYTTTCQSCRMESNHLHSIQIRSNRYLQYSSKYRKIICVIADKTNNSLINDFALPLSYVYRQSDSNRQHKSCSSKYLLFTVRQCYYAAHL